MVHAHQKEGARRLDAIGVCHMNHDFCQLMSILHRLLKGGSTVLDVQYERIGSFGNLFTHNAGRLKWNG